MKTIWPGPGYNLSDIQRVPPLPANLGQACYNCFVEDSPETPLSTCSDCMRVAYCSKECQTHDWGKHRAPCIALQKLEDSDDAYQSVMYFNGQVLQIASRSALERRQFARRVMFHDIMEFEGYLLAEGKALGAEDRELFFREPRCCICGITDRLIRKHRRFGIATVQHVTPPRLQTKSGKPKAASLPLGHNEIALSTLQQSSLAPCTMCQTTYFCSSDHRALARAHFEERILGDSEGFTQCELNCRLRASIRLRRVLVKLVNEAPQGDSEPGILKSIEPNGRVRWVPSRIEDHWRSLKGRTWESEFLDHLREAAKPLPPLGTALLPDPHRALLWAASEGLSIPMSILWALEVFNGANNTWTKQETLRIHIVEATERDFAHIAMFEEILHRLPDVQNLEVTMFGPEVMNFIGATGASNPRDVQLCSECRRRGRQQSQLFATTLYHTFVEQGGLRFVKPDIVADFDAEAGGGRAGAQTWREIIKTLTKLRIPTVFTARTKEQIIADSKSLRKIGVALKKELGPRYNPWGSLALKTDGNAVGVDNFFTANGWIAGGVHH